MQNNPIVAMKWLEEAVIQAAMDGNKTVKDSQIQQVLFAHFSVTISKWNTIAEYCYLGYQTSSKETHKQSKFKKGCRKR